MKNNIVELLIEKKIGLDAEAIGRKLVEKAIAARMAQCRVNSARAYAEILRNSDDEWKHLIEMVVVPETWFFRNRKAFHYLVRFATDDWLPRNCGRSLNVLSIPCSTGEEPYSIAMALLDAGIQEDRFRIAGIDISEKALERARDGVYGQASFRGKDLSFRDHYFQRKGDVYRLLDPVRGKVLFKIGNIMERHFATGLTYDVIFCRNLMIYMSPAARNQTLETMSRLLDDKGIFFCGHAERQTALDWGFEAINETGVFACRKRCRESGEKGATWTVEKVPVKRGIHGAGSRPNQIKPKPIRKPASKKEVPSLERADEHREPDPGTIDAAMENTVDLFPKAKELADHGKLLDALELCEIFLNENPVHVEAHFLTGLIFEALHDAERAEAFFNRTIYLNPEHVEALNHMAFIELQRGNKAGAERLRKRAQRIGMGGVEPGSIENQTSGRPYGK